MPIRYSYAEIHVKVEMLLKDRLNKLGSICTNDAWLICRDEPTIQYNSLAVHFREIMKKMIEDKKADALGKGKYFIYRNNFGNGKANRL